MWQKIAKVGDKVRCINPNNGIVKEGVYEVKEVYTSNGSGGKDYMYRLVGNSIGYYAHRFEIVNGIKKSIPSSKSSIQTTDISDDTLSFFKSVGKGMCACNMPKDQCSYHKG